MDNSLLETVFIAISVFLDWDVKKRECLLRLSSLHLSSIGRGTVLSCTRSTSRTCPGVSALLDKASIS